MSVNKFKVGDVVKCVDVSSINNLTLRKEYIVLQTQTDIALCVYGDNGDFGRYCPSRFELSNGGSANAQQTHKSPKFKEGDMVKVRILEIDRFGKIKLSAKAVAPIEKKVQE